MLCSLTLTRADGTDRYAILLDPARMILSEGEEPLDILLEIIASHAPFDRPDRLLDILRGAATHGRSHIAGCFLPGFLSLSEVHPHFPLPADTRIALTLAPRDDPPSASRIEIGAGDSFPLCELRAAPERNHAGQRDGHVFALDRTDRDPGRPNPEDLAAGSFVTGLFEALLEEPDPAPSRLAAVHAALGLILAARAGFSIQTDADEPPDIVLSTLGHAHFMQFQIHGALISDRGWNPRRWRAGPLFAQALGEADPEMRRFAHTLFPALADIPAGRARDILGLILHDPDLPAGSPHSRPPDFPSAHSHLDIIAARDRLLARLPGRGSVSPNAEE